MRKSLRMAALPLLAAGLVGWASFGSAQPGAAPPVTLPVEPVAPEAGPYSVPMPGTAVSRPVPGSKADPKAAPRPVTAPVVQPKGQPQPITLPGTPSEPTLAPGALPPVGQPQPTPTGQESRKADGPGTPMLPGNSPAVLPDPQSVAQPAPQSVAEPTSQAAPQPVAQPAAQPTTGQASQPLTEMRPSHQAEVHPSHPAGHLGGLEGNGSGPGQEPGNPTGRQEPAVSLEWIGPAAAKVGQPADYAIMVRNVCNIAVQKVIVQVRVPQGVNVAATEPKAEANDNVLMWEVGTLLPRQEKRIQMKFVSPAKGDMACQAWVTFTGSSVMRMMVREPKLLVKATAPEKALVGDPAHFVLTVSNPGDHPAELVKITATLSEGLENARGNTIKYDVGTLAPGDTRSVQVLCIAKAGGEQKCEATAEADGGLKAADKATLNVITPRLDLEVNGPKLRYLDRKAVYTFKVTNPGDAPASNVTISDVLPEGFKFLGADNGGRHDFSTRSVAWFLGEVGPGQTREVKMEVLAINPGEHQHKVTAQASRGLKVEGEILTRVEGLSAMLMEVVDVEDPVEVSAETAYEIRVTNTGSKTETDVKLVCTVPPQMQFKSAQGPVRFQQTGSEIVFDPLPKLAPRADAIYRIVVVATGKGDARFKAQLTSTNLVEPVIKQESTRVYGD